MARPVPEDPATTARRVIDAINNRTIQDRTAELLAEPFTRHDLAQIFLDRLGAGGAADFVTTILAAIPDLHLDIDDIFANTDTVTLLLHMTGTHTGAGLLGQPATGHRLSANAVFIYRLTDRRVAEAWQMIDGLAFHRLADPSS